MLEIKQKHISPFFTPCGPEIIDLFYLSKRYFDLPFLIGDKSKKKHFNSTKFFRNEILDDDANCCTCNESKKECKVLEPVSDPF